MRLIGADRFHIYELNGQLFWGYYGRHSNLYRFEWVFRSKPIQLERWYVSKGFAFQVFYLKPTSFSEGGFCVDVTFDCGKTMVHHGFVRNRMNLFSADGTSAIVCNDHELFRREFRNFFRNRLIEYSDDYFIPMKAKKHFRQRNVGYAA